MKKITEEVISSLVEMFYPLKCWKVGLSYGSQIYFEFGKKIKDKSLKSEEYIGSSTLWVEGDHWTIYYDHNEIENSDSITRDAVESVLQKYFIGEVLNKLYVQQGVLIAQFSNKLLINIQIIPEEWNDELDSLITWVLPDGRYISYDSPYGFNINQTVNETRRNEWLGESKNNL